MALTRYVLNTKTAIFGNGTAARIPSAGNVMQIEVGDEIHDIGVLPGTYISIDNVTALIMDDADYANLSLEKYNITTAFFLK